MNVVFREDVTYERMLEKCVETVYPPEKRVGAEFYLANGGGIAICPSSKKFSVDTSDSQSQEIEWTLMQYISLSGVKYPSKARIYCVRKEVADSDEEGAGNDASGATAMDTHSQHDDASQTQQSEDEERYKKESGALSQEYGLPFQPLFLCQKESLYRDKSSEMITTQDSVVCCHCEDIELRERSLTLMEELKDGSSPHIFPDNPCHLGMKFVGIDIPGMCDVICVRVIWYIIMSV